MKACTAGRLRRTLKAAVYPVCGQVSNLYVITSWGDRYQKKTWPTAILFPVERRAVPHAPFRYRRPNRKLDRQMRPLPWIGSALMWEMQPICTEKVELRTTSKPGKNDTDHSLILKTALLKTGEENKFGSNITPRQQMIIAPQKRKLLRRIDRLNMTDC